MLHVLNKICPWDFGAVVQKHSEKFMIWRFENGALKEQDIGFVAQ